jgi:hypothetical protein
MLTLPFTLCSKFLPILGRSTASQNTRFIASHKQHQGGHSFYYLENKLIPTWTWFYSIFLESNQLHTRVVCAILTFPVQFRPGPVGLFEHGTGKQATLNKQADLGISIMAFAAAVMSTAGGHRVFNNGSSSTSPTASTSTSVTPPRQLGASIIPINSNSSSTRARTISNNSNTSGTGYITPSTSSRSISKMATSPGLDTNYITHCNTSLSSFKPRLSPTTSPIMKNTTSLPDSPQMIRCSTCNCLVSLFDLSDHICKPVAATTATTNTASSPSNTSLAQLRHPGSTLHAHSRLGSGFTHHVQSSAQSAQANVSTNHRPLLNPLRVNVSHAAQRGVQYEARELFFAVS